MKHVLPVPDSVTPEILLFSQHIAPGSTPVYLSITPILDAKPLHCFPNVDLVVKTKGGRVEYGWLLWERPKIMYEAEFHAVWLDNDGRYVDVTPQNNEIAEVLFLPDGSRIYQGRPVHNLKWPLQCSALLREYLRVDKELNAERDKGEFIAGTSIARYSPGVAARIDQLEQILHMLQTRILAESSAIK